MEKIKAKIRTVTGKCLEINRQIAQFIPAGNEPNTGDNL